MSTDLDPILPLASDLGLPSPVDRLSIAPTADLYGCPFAVTDAALAVHSERFLQVPALTGIDLRHPVSGNDATADGWIGLRTNLQAHLEATLRVLGTTAHRSEVARASARWRSLDLEEAVTTAGGVAGAMRTLEGWRSHPQAEAVRGLPFVGRRDLGTGRRGRGTGAGRSERRLDGIRVLDLTRVIAGPIAGRFLASFGADVLRVDPTGAGGRPPVRLRRRRAVARPARVRQRRAGGDGHRTHLWLHER